MIHPFFDPTVLKDNELDAKRQKLLDVYFNTTNQEIRNQTRAILDLIQNELQERRARQFEKQCQNRDKNLDSLIKVR